MVVTVVRPLKLRVRHPGNCQRQPIQIHRQRARRRDRRRLARPCNRGDRQSSRSRTRSSIPSGQQSASGFPRRTKSSPKSDPITGNTCRIPLTVSTVCSRPYPHSPPTAIVDPAACTLFSVRLTCARIDHRVARHLIVRRVRPADGGSATHATPLAAGNAAVEVLNALATPVVAIPSVTVPGAIEFAEARRHLRRSARKTLVANVVPENVAVGPIRLFAVLAPPVSVPAVIVFAGFRSSR